MQRVTILIAVIVFSIGSLYAQNIDPDKLYWSDTRKIEINDFSIHTSDASKASSSVVFEIEYGVRGFNFMRENFNQKITHYMVKPSSQILIDENVEQYLRYQQMIFDIQELYVRQLRKAVSENRKKLIFTTGIVDDLRKRIIDNEMYIRQALYAKETSSCANTVKQLEWEKQITQELKDLSKYAYNY